MISLTFLVKFCFCSLLGHTRPSSSLNNLVRSHHHLSLLLLQKKGSKTFQNCINLLGRDYSRVHPFYKIHFLSITSQFLKLSKYYLGNYKQHLHSSSKESKTLSRCSHSRRSEVWCTLAQGDVTRMDCSFSFME